MRKKIGAGARNKTRGKRSGGISKAKAYKIGIFDYVGDLQAMVAAFGVAHIIKLAAFVDANTIIEGDL